MSFNSIYMFKNAIRHFLNVAKIDYNVGGLLEVDDINKLAWTRPIDFIIRRHYDNNDLRLLKLPNLLNFYNLYSKVLQTDKFASIEDVSIYSKMRVNLETGDFSAFSYKEDLERDLLKLTEYDFLLKLDIKSFYDSIYTHDLEQKIGIGFSDRFISNCNLGSTKGILMGSYVSLFLAEKMLSVIAIKVHEKLKEKSIRNSIKYFSDDFYIFIDQKDINQVKHEFSLILSEYGLSDNSKKDERFDYIEYNNENVIDKYWNTILANQRFHERKTDEISRHLLRDKKIDTALKYKLNFLNQLIYRKGKLSNRKFQSILINGFFKSNFFIDLNPDKYEFESSNLHNILYLMREHPEIVLYVIPKFMKFKYFFKSIKQNLKDLFVKSLEKPFEEEQMYYFFGLLMYDKRILHEENIVNNVLKTQNQILKSYYVYEGWLDDKLDDMLDEEEKYWFINYHIILRIKTIREDDLNELIKKYLIPKFAQKTTQIDLYLEFYKNNLEKNITLVNQNPAKQIEEYLENKKVEREAYNTVS